MIPNTDLYHKALRLAAWAHHAQVTKFGDPYITHPIAASYEVFSAAMAGEVFDINLAVICAILHDVVEKSDVTLRSIQKDFGKTIANGVEALSKNPNIEESEQLRDSLLRILEQPKEIAIVKLADRISGMLIPPDEWENDKKITMINNATMILQMMGGASPYLSKRLKKKIKFYERRTECHL